MMLIFIVSIHEAFQGFTNYFTLFSLTISKHLLEILVTKDLLNKL
jgi:hypothetical protein